MSDDTHRWYVVRFKTKDDPKSPGIDYWFGENSEQAVRFPTEQDAHSIRALMIPGVTFTLTDGRRQTVHDFEVEKLEEYRYAIYTKSEIPQNPLGVSERGA